jgi:hypothetical protein
MTRIAAALAVWLCAAISAFAQDIARLPLVGVLQINTAANNEPTATILRDALGALGDIDRKSIRLDFRLAEGDAGRFPELAAALVRDNPSVIVATSAHRRCGRRSTRRRRSRSSQALTTSSPQDLSTAWRSLAATSPGSAS